MNPLQLIPDPYRFAAQALAVALVIGALIAFGWSKGADHVQTKWDAEKGRALAAQIVAEQTARQREQSMISQIRKAENDANDREEKRRAAVAAAGDSADKLRLALNTIRNGLPGNSADACRATADAAIAVFGECAAEAGSLADKAGGHASDVQTLSESWPK
ncbi:MAG: DUF2514 family protein [Azonexus sp.]